MFWAETAKLAKARRKSAKFRAFITLTMAVISSPRSWPTQRRASGPPSHSSGGASEITGPRDDSRISTVLSNHQRTLISSVRLRIAEGGRAEMS